MKKFEVMVRRMQTYKFEVDAETERGARAEAIELSRELTPMYDKVYDTDTQEISREYSVHYDFSEGKYTVKRYDLKHPSAYFHDEKDAQDYAKYRNEKENAK